MFFNKAFCFSLAFVVLAGCASVDNGGEQPTVWNRIFSGGYSYGTFKYLARKSSVLIQVIGKPTTLTQEDTIFAFKEGVVASREMYGLQAVLEPHANHSSEARLVFFLQPPEGMSTHTICESQDPKKLQTNMSDRLDLELIAVYCQRMIPRSSLTAGLGKSEEISKERLSRITRNLMIHLLPPKNPMRSSGCSDTNNIDC